MSRPATSRLKVNAPLGLMPALQYLLPQQLKIDPVYQRSLDTGPSQTLVRRIAMFWNWDLCQPLVVARRDNGDLFVIDGQHRLEAARLRGDIAQLPAVVVQYESAADEAASFVHLNQQRRPLQKLDIFKAAIASGDPDSSAILKSITDAGLSIAPTTNPDAWKPGQIVNIGGIERAWRSNSPNVVRAALRALGQAFDGQTLRYAGTIFPGIVAVCGDELRKDVDAAEKWPHLIKMLASKSQAEWRTIIYASRGEKIDLNLRMAAETALRGEWASWAPSAAAVAPPAPAREPTAIVPATDLGEDRKRWCGQCERRISVSAATLCKSRFCRLRPSLAAAR